MHRKRNRLPLLNDTAVGYRLAFYFPDSHQINFQSFTFQ